MDHGPGCDGAGGVGDCGEGEEGGAVAVGFDVGACAVGEVLGVGGGVVGCVCGEDVGIWVGVVGDWAVLVIALRGSEEAYSSKSSRPPGGLGNWYPRLAGLARRPLQQLLGHLQVQCH